MLGQKAYYLSALFDFRKLLAGAPIEIESDEFCEEENAILFLVSNSPVVGGFQNILPGARFDDGLLHVLVVRKGSVIKTAQTFLDIQKGSHIGNPDVLYFTTKKLRITQHQADAALGIDGERGSARTINIGISPHALTLVVPKLLTAA